MNLKFLCIVLGIIGMMTVSSCQDDSIADTLSEKGLDIQKVNRVMSRHLNDDESVYRLQTDQIGMLIHSIEKNGNEYILTISHEDAILLGIPDSTYQIAQSILRDYNSLGE
ncbi:MAG: hypothetical protein HFJ95_04320 [Muribaculaceae bacterium]|nr:hypothetical protein [Muribaculaceae bacterium]